MDTSPLKLPIHSHFLFPSSRIIHSYCDICGIEGPIYGGYRCNDEKCYNVWFHKECAESPAVINHPSHPDHPLKLTVDIAEDEKCRLCEASVLSAGYYCSKCKFLMHIRCSRNSSFKPLLPKLVVKDLASHRHPLTLSTVVTSIGYYPCEVCNLTVYSRQVSYDCLRCNKIFHVECVNLSVEVNHPSHPTHSLKLTRSKDLASDAEKTCLLCGKRRMKSLYHCSVCNFSLCLYCVRNPPPLSIEHFKTHSHQLILLASQVEFTCRVCGMQGSRSPYLCLPCGFMVHQSCIDLPSVININRHDHRISFTPHLGSRNSKCPICRQDFNRYYGAYSCSICKDYVVHSHCAARKDVWDGIELEGIYEDTEGYSSFTIEGLNLIRHFLHDKHILRLNKDGLGIDGSTRCEACIFPVYSDPIYSCEQCNFVLHQTCAKLPRKKRNMFDVRPLRLEGHYHDEDNSLKSWFQCKICKTVSNGFKYRSDDTYTDLFMDVICSSFSEPFTRHDPLPPLYLSDEENDGSKCVACGKEIRGMRKMCSDDGKIVLDFRCANLPKTVKHRYDEHMLSLCYGEDASGKYWCEICEEEVDTKRWFYTCSDCGTTLHIDCVVGDFSNIKPGFVYRDGDSRIEVVTNNQSFRPFCNGCHSRCKGPFFLKMRYWQPGNICSLSCAITYFPWFNSEYSISVDHLT